MQNELRIAFIGGGNMAAALIGGLAGKLAPAKNIHVVDINEDALRALRERYGVTTAPAIEAALASCQVIVLAVKPQQMKTVATELHARLVPLDRILVLSIAAGIRAADLSRWLGGHAALVRAMPNTPALIGQGVTGMAALPGVSPAQRETADAVMRAAGLTVWLENEAMLDSLTAISGSGPAYVFYFIEAMQQAARELGLDQEQARILSLATFAGASQLALQSEEDVATLRARVTSKGGTTHAAISAMEAAGMKESIVRALKAAAARSRELGDELGGQ